MPIEIRELVIKAAIADEMQSTAAQPEQSSSSGSEALNEALIRACVESVLEIIKQKTER